jgi:DNA-binding Lrp family transcriptional regulator
MNPQLDDVDRRIINRLQDDLVVTDRPFDEPAAELGITVGELLDRLSRLKECGIFSRVGPMFNSARMGGGLTLCAMSVPQFDFDRVAHIVNSFPEVAHNYEREHELNMWFVLATETEVRITEVISEIEQLTEIKVLNLPKLHEFYIGMRVEA